jgi:molybdate transport system substrate-binding protein
MMWTRWVFVVALLLLPAPAWAGEKVTVFAAASLKTALDEVATAWEDGTQNSAVLSYAASSALAKQIEQGAPADMFFSADMDWMDHLAMNGLIDRASTTPLLGNELVLIAPKNSTATVSITPGFPLAELLGEGRLAIADVKSVPAGKYGKAALQTLGVWDKAEGRLAQAENVRAALKLVATGEAPLGIVYRTDALAEPTVKVLGVFPAESHPPIIYPVARVVASSAPAAASFLSFLASPEAAEIFKAHGFRLLH